MISKLVLTSHLLGSTPIRYYQKLLFQIRLRLQIFFYIAYPIVSVTVTDIPNIPDPDRFNWFHYSTQTRTV